MAFNAGVGRNPPIAAGHEQLQAIDLVLVVHIDFQIEVCTIAWGSSGVVIGIGEGFAVGRGAGGEGVVEESGEEEGGGDEC